MKKLLILLLFIGCIRSNSKSPYLEQNAKVQINVRVLQAAAAIITNGLSGSVVEINDSFDTTSGELYGVAKTSATIKKKDGSLLVFGIDYTYGQDISFYDTSSCIGSLPSAKLLKICFDNINITQLGITKVIAKDLSTITYPTTANTAFYDPARNTIVMPGAITWYEYTGYYGKGNKIINGLSLADSTGNSTSANLASLNEVTSPILGYEFYSTSGGAINDTYSYNTSNIATDNNIGFFLNSSYTFIFVYNKTLRTQIQVTVQDSTVVYEGIRIDQSNNNSQSLYCNNATMNSSTITGTLYDTNNNGNPNKSLMYWGVNGSSYDLSALGTTYSITGTKGSCFTSTIGPKTLSFTVNSGTFAGTTNYYFKGALKIYPFYVDKAWIQSKFISGTSYDFTPMLSQYCNLSNCSLNKFVNATIRYYK